MAHVAGYSGRKFDHNARSGYCEEIGFELIGNIETVHEPKPIQPANTLSMAKVDGYGDSPQPDEWICK